MMKRTDNLTGHGSAGDRGSADAYYRRSFKPHYINNENQRVEADNMTSAELEAYRKAYNEQEDSGDFKRWD